MSKLPKVVEEIGEMSYEGNIIPHTWYQHLRYANGKPHLNAITILSDILYWYRPKEIRAEGSGRLIRREKRFDADKLQRSYQQFGDLFGLSIQQARTAIDFLVQQGVIVKEIRPVVKIGKQVLSNVMYLEPVPEAIRELNKIETPLFCRTDPPHVENRPSPSGEQTYTEITTETTSESSELTLAIQVNGDSIDSIKEATQPKVSDSTSDVSEQAVGAEVLAQAFPESQKLYEQRMAQAQNGDKPQGWLQGLSAGIRRIREADWQIKRAEVEQLLGEFIEVTGLFPQSESARKQWIAAGNKQLKDYGVQTLVTDGLYRQAWEAIEADRKETGKKLSITSPYSIGFKIEELLQERARVGDDDLTEAEMKRLGEVFKRMKAENLIVQAGMVWVVRADDTKLRSRQDFLTYADQLGW